MADETKKYNIEINGLDKIDKDFENLNKDIIDTTKNINSLKNFL